MSTKTLKLIKSLDSGCIPEGGVAELIELARFNKVLLGLLKRVGYGGQLRAAEEERYRGYMSGVAEAAKALKGLDYALFKFRKPVEHVSVDIDVLIKREHIPKAAKKLAELGFRIEVAEPYTLTMTREEAIVDLRSHRSPG